MTEQLTLSYLWSQSFLRHLDARLSDVCKANPFPSQVSSPLLVFTAHLQPLHLVYVFLFSVPPVTNCKLYSVLSILFLVNLPSLKHEHKYLYCLVSASFMTQISAWLIQSIRWAFQSVPFSHSVLSKSVTPWTAARQASPSSAVSWSLLKLMSIESVMPSNHLILHRPLLLLCLECRKLLKSFFSAIKWGN